MLRLPLDPFSGELQMSRVTGYSAGTALPGTWDYKDRLTLASDLAAQLRGLTEAYEDPLVELWECAILNVAAGILRSDIGRLPTEQEVQTLAHRMRTDLLTQALAKEDALGEPAPMMTQAEADLRIFCHDAVVRDHDEDYCMYAAFPLEELADKVLAASCSGRAAENFRP